MIGDSLVNGWPDTHSPVASGSGKYCLSAVPKAVAEESGLRLIAAASIHLEGEVRRDALAALRSINVEGLEKIR